MKQAIGIDIGGTKIAAAIVDEKGKIRHRVDIPTDTSSAEAVFDCVIAAIDQVLDKAQKTIDQVEGIGIGLPGKVDVKNGIAQYQNNIPWKDFPIVSRLSDRYPDLPIKIDNDVKVAAYAEYRMLDLDPEDLFGYLTVSTGIACTNIMGGQIIRGSGFSGEVGFIPVPSSTGLRGVEKVAAGPAIEKLARELYQDPDMTTAQVFERWHEWDPIASQIIDQSVVGIALVIYQMICFLDPKAITLGGSVALKNPDFVQRIIDEVSGICHPEQTHIIDQIRLSNLEGHNGLIGAGLLVID